MPKSWVSHRPPTTDSTLWDCWAKIVGNSDYYERLGTSYCLALKKELIDDVYTVPIEISCLHDCTTDRPMLIWSSNLFICKCLLLIWYHTIVLRSSQGQCRWGKQDWTHHGKRIGCWRCWPWSMESVLPFRSWEVVFAPNTGIDTHHAFSCVAAISFLLLDTCHCILTQNNLILSL